MNLGRASNVDLSEAARLLKQSAGGAATGISNQQVPPSMMLMQQAVAMQQFQFQQALLMQQMMATQQAAARAATVKSAQEMAAARAAEISKQLKGNEPEAKAEEKKSPRRSVSRTPSRSRSRSFSRSKSRSPLRYRRGRSDSRSPIRYRCNSRPSPIAREYFGYRGRSRRGYYRGRGEYAAWNASYRRDWELRDYSSRSRRSRSRVRRRSRTRSRSPRSRRDRSCTPPRYHREGRRSGRGSRRSRSVEARPTPSRSSGSRSQSRSESLHGSQSPARKPRDARSGGGPRKSENLSTLMSSPDTKGRSKGRSKDRDEQSISPARSLSVSLSPPRRKDGEGLEGLEIDTKGACRSKGGDFLANGRNAGGTEVSSDVSDGNKEVDDWRDDMKANELGKIKGMESKQEIKRREGEEKALPVQVEDQGMTVLEHGTCKLRVEGIGEANAAAAKTKIGTTDNGFVGSVDSEETRTNGNKDVVVKEEVLQRVSTGNGGGGDVEMEEEPGNVTNEKSTGSADVIDREEDSEVVFEGPKLAYEEVYLDLGMNGRLKERHDSYREAGKKSPNSLKGGDSAEEIEAEQPPSAVAEEEVVKGKDKSRTIDEEDVHGLQRGKDKSRLKEEEEEEEELYDNRKSKLKSRSRERSRRDDDETDHERRKDKHRKHERRHRRDEETEKKEDIDDDDEKRNVDDGKDKEEQRHHRSKKHRSGRDQKEDKREKKRRRHNKHQGESPDKESLAVEAEGAEDVDQVAGRVHKLKHSSSRENRRKEVSKSPSSSGSD